jgi:predicted phosphodiesterase
MILLVKSVLVDLGVPMNINSEITDIKKQNPNMEWDKIATIVNWKHGTNLSGNACRKRFKRINPESTVNYTYKLHDYRRNVPLTLRGNTMFIPDTHAPFTVPGALDFISDVGKRYNIKNVFHLGDVVDSHALGFFDHDPDGESAGSELYKAKKFVKELVKLFPNVYACIGNHDNRHLRQALKHGLPKAYIREFSEILETPDTWQWHYSYIINGETLVTHGSTSGMRSTYDLALMTSLNAVSGHTHSYAGVTYINDGFKQRWALNGGCLADNDSYAMKYAADSKFKHTLGVAIVVDEVPMFIPFNHGQ